MIERHWGKALLRPEHIQPTNSQLQVAGVFNPGAAVVNGEVVLLVRVAECPSERRDGFTPLPRWEVGRGPVIDWLPNADVDWIDPRAVRVKSEELIRLTFISHLRVVRCGDGRSVESVTDLGVWPETLLEEYGVEDPRITHIGDRYWITYVIASRHGVSTALLSTTDFRSFERHGVIFTVENKDIVFFPEKIGGEYMAIHRPVGYTPLTRPEMWVARSSNLFDWGRHQPLAWERSGWEDGRVGSGPPPVKTPEGWLLMYHGNRRPRAKGEVGAYCSGALLLDLKDPTKILKRTPTPFFVPEVDYEKTGFVPDVVFPTGIVEKGNSLLVYYGSADAYTAAVEFSRDDVLRCMK